MINYRNQAREYLGYAKAELALEDDYRLRYAALDLRFAIEALTYDRAVAYKAELPPSEYETWQPRKLMAVLLEIDPNADKDSTLAFGREETYGVQAPIMKHAGTETIFNLALLKKHYDALGSHLHVPTLKQAQAGPPSPAKLRQRCNDVAAFVEKVLASRVWNITLGNFAKIDCQECGAAIRKRIPHGKGEVTATCFECSTTYTIVDVGNGALEWRLDMIDVSCGDDACGHVIHILKREFERGSSWRCPACKGRNTLRLGVAFEADAPETDAAPVAQATAGTAV